MLRKFAPWALLAGMAGAFVLARPSVADNPPDKDKAKTDAPAAAKPTTVKAEKGPLVAAVSLKGVVEGGRMKEVSVRLKNWQGPLQARSAVEHGTAVKAGDVLVEFDPEKLDQIIRDARQERDLAELAIKLAEVELPIAERMQPLDLAAAEREHKQAAEDLKRFLDVDRPMSVQSAEFSLKAANFYVEYARDELKQLAKMYKDKDLTEETEEMILKRYKFTLEMEEHFARQSKVRVEEVLSIYLPRQEQMARDRVAKSELALAKARNVDPLAVDQKRLTLAKLRFEQTKAKERLAELEKDREALTVKASADGIVYHGKSVNGKWTALAGPQGPALLSGSPINSGDVFLTVVSPTQLVIRAEAEEKELPGLKKGVAAKVTATALPDKKMAARVAKVAAAPQDGKFDVRVELDGDPADGLVPGMTCTARVVTAKKDSAVTVPASAVFSDDADEDAKYVYKPGKDGKHEKRPVKVGLTVGDKVEILDGLADGDEILASKP